MADGQTNKRKNLFSLIWSWLIEGRIEGLRRYKAAAGQRRGVINAGLGDGRGSGYSKLRILKWWEGTRLWQMPQFRWSWVMPGEARLDLWDQSITHNWQKGGKLKKKLKSTFHSIGLFRIICSTDYKKRSENILMTSHLEVNHLQITCWRILGNKAKKGWF